MSTIGDAVDEGVGDVTAIARTAMQKVADVAVEQAQADVKAQLDGALATAARLQQLLNDADARHTADQEALAALQKRFDDYVAAHPDTDPPPPPPAEVLFGISVNDETDVARVEKWTTPDAVKGVREFYTGPMPGKWTDDKRVTGAYANGVRFFHLSTHATITEAWGDAFHPTVPADCTILLTEDHEPENDPFDRAKWEAAQTAASTVTHDRGFEFAITLMGYTFNPSSGRDPEKFWVDGIGAWLGVDLYNKDLAVAIPRIEAFCAKHGDVPWGLSETGASTDVHGKPQSQAERLAWAKDSRALLLASKARWALWWDVLTKNPDGSAKFDNTLNDELADAFFGLS